MHKNNQLEDVVLGHTVVSHHEKPKLSCWFGYNWGRKPEISGKEDLSFLGPEGGIPRASELCHKILGLGHVFFPHKFNTNLRKHHIFWWEQQVTRQNPWMMTASCQAYPAYLKKCRSCARIFECLTTNLLSFMSWWFGRVKTALNHQRFGSANWMTPSQHWSTSWNQVLGCPIPISFIVFFWEWYHPIFHKHEYCQPPRSNHFLVYPIRIPPMMPCRGCRGFVRSRYDSPTYPWLPSGNLT